MKKSWEKAVESALEANDYLKGDDCQSSENFLVGWAWSNFRALENRAPSAAEADGILKAVQKFLKSE